MADGSWSVDHNWSPALYDELVDANGDPRKLHALFYVDDGSGGWTLTDIMLMQTVEANKNKGITIGGTGLAWWLGSRDKGPLIIKREYISGNNKLSNGDFELDEDGYNFVAWKIGELSNWVPSTFPSHSGAGAAMVLGDSTNNDALVSDETFDVTPGQQYRSNVWLYGGSGAGRMRIRVVFDGKFSPQNVLTNGGFESATGWTETSTVANNAQVILGDPVFAHTGSGHLRMYTTKFAPVVNGGFETGTLAGWVEEAGTWPISPDQHYTGSYSISTAGGGPTKKFAHPSNAPYAVVPGQRWRVQGAIKAVPPGDGPITDGRFRLIVRLYNQTGTEVGTIIAGDVGGPDVPDWVIKQEDFEIPEGVFGITPKVMAEGHTVGSWYADGVEVVRLQGNRCSMNHTDFFYVTAERGYRLRAFVRSDGETMTGKVWARFAFWDAAGTPINTIVEGSPQSVSQDWVRYEYVVVPPSGVAFMTLIWFGEDIFGGAFHVDDCEIIDTDDETMVFDALSAAFSLGWTQITQDVTVPNGAVKMHTEVVAEAHAGGWHVDDVVLSRLAPHSTHADVIRDLLLDPDTHLPMTVIAGSITGPGDISFDWTIQRRITRDALEHFCRVIASPQMEWRINSPTRTLDAGPPISVFTDHLPTGSDPLVFLEDDISVTEMPGVVLSSADQVEKVLVVGADRTTTSGQTTTVTGVATVATGQVDWNGRSPNRTGMVEDSTVDHQGYATALAAQDASRNANPAKTVTVALSGADNRGAPPGDWVYAYKPSAGLESPLYPVPIDGRDVFPAQKRVLNRKRTLAQGRIDLRRLDGSTFTLTGVIWDKDAATTLELTDIIPVFESDPQGGRVARQFLNFRASSPKS